MVYAPGLVGFFLACALVLAGVLHILNSRSIQGNLIPVVMLASVKSTVATMTVLFGMQWPTTASLEGVSLIVAGLYGTYLAPAFFGLLGLFYTPNRLAGYVVATVFLSYIGYNPSNFQVPFQVLGSIPITCGSIAMLAYLLIISKQSNSPKNK